MANFFFLSPDIWFTCGIIVLMLMCLPSYRSQHDMQQKGFYVLILYYVLFLLITSILFQLNLPSVTVYYCNNFFVSNALVSYSKIFIYLVGIVCVIYVH